jgi:serine/threonine protein kinase
MEHSTSSPSSNYRTGEGRQKKEKPDRQHASNAKNAASDYADRCDLDLCTYRFHGNTLMCRLEDSSHKKTTLLVKNDTTGAEARIFSVVRSKPHIVRLIDFHIEAPLLLLHEEFMQPVDSQFTDDMDYWTVTSTAVDLTLDCLFGLRELQSANVVHGDISPRNIMYSPTDCCFKLTDLSHSFLFSSQEIKRGGTRNFIAPEVQDGGGACFRSDLYSLGTSLRDLVFYRLVGTSNRANMFEPPMYRAIQLFFGLLCRPDPMMRPSVDEAISIFLQGWHEWSYIWKDEGKGPPSRFDDLADLEAKGVSAGFIDSKIHLLDIGPPPMSSTEKTSVSIGREEMLVTSVVETVRVEQEESTVKLSVSGFSEEEGVKTMDKLFSGNT